jgi:phage gp37-like protein
MSSPVRLIENAMVTRLAEVERGYKRPVVESYAGQLDDELFSWVRTLPAVWVTFSGTTETKRVGANSWIVRGTFEVLSAQRALVKNEARLAGVERGDAVGVYELMEDNKLALINQKLDLGIDPIQPGAIRSVVKGNVRGEPIAIFAQEFRTGWREVNPSEDAEPSGTLIRVGLNYHLGINGQLPTEPTRTDLIEN